MTTLIASVPSVNLDHDAPAEFAPSEADERWAAETFNADAADFDVEPAANEWAAAESAALDCIEAGFVPPDGPRPVGNAPLWGILGRALAEALSRSSLVGLADDMP